jgi:hypothetical protein
MLLGQSLVGISFCIDVSHLYTHTTLSIQVVLVFSTCFHRYSGLYVLQKWCALLMSKVVIFRVFGLSPVQFQHFDVITMTNNMYGTHYFSLHFMSYTSTNFVFFLTIL